MIEQDKNAEIEFFSQQAAKEQGSYLQVSLSRQKKELEILRITSPWGKLILDAGCGTGTYGLALASQGNKVIGVDLSTDSLEVARNRAIQKGLDFTPVEGDLEKLPFEDNTFDTCICAFILHHLPNMEKPLAELYRVLKPQGTIALIEPNASNPAAKISCIFRLYLMREVCERRGFASKNERAYHYKHYLDVLQKAGFQNLSYISQRVSKDKSTEHKQKNTLLNRLFWFILNCREIAFIISARFLPQPYKWPTLYITGTKLPRDKP